MQSSTPSADTVLRIGTRGSPLALVQAGQVRARLAAAHGLAPERIGIEIIRTSGDMIRDRPLSEVGGKGLFTKEIEDALLAGRIDLAVHSAKDMPTVLPDGLAIVWCCRARIRAMPSSAAGAAPCTSFRMARSSAPRRCGDRRR